MPVEKIIKNNSAAKIKEQQERYQKLKAKLKLVKYFLRNGYLRFPNENLRKLKGKHYKKGYEVRLVANDENELVEINSLVEEAGFRVRKPFKKHNRFIQPIYGKKIVAKFQIYLARTNRIKK